MHFSGRSVIERSREDLYEKLRDPAILRMCIPGCEELVAGSDGTFSTSIRVPLGLIRGRFAGRVTLRDALPPEGYSLYLRAEGKLGAIEGRSRISLKALQGERTEILYEGDIRLEGPIAVLGKRLLANGSANFPEQFFSSLKQALDR